MRRTIQEKDGAWSMWNFRHQVGMNLQSARKESSLCNRRHTLDAFILARHWILAVLRKTGSSRNQSGHLVSGGDSGAQRLSVHQGARQPSQGTLHLHYVPPYMCTNDKFVLINWCLLEVYSIFPPFSVIRRRVNNASGTQRRGGFCAPAQRICKYLWKI